MEEKKEFKGAGLKYFLFIGIPVIIVLGVLGAYYYATNPLTVLTKTINTTYEKINQMIKENEKTDKININGNLTFNTNANLLEYESLKDYTYNFNLGIDSTQKILKLGLGMYDQNQNIIDASLYQIEKKQYLESKKIYPNLLELPEVETFTDFESFNQNNYSSEDIKIILKKLKDALISTLDEKYISREKKDIKIQNNTIKATKITYLLNKENQERTTHLLKDKILNDGELVEKISKFLNKTIEETKKEIQTNLDNFKYEEDIEINLYTESLKQNVVKIEIESSTEKILTIENYKNNQSINIDNTIKLDILNMSDEKKEINYQIINSNINGKIKIETKYTNRQESQIKVFFSITYQDTTIDLNMDMNVYSQEDITIPDLENSKNVEDLTNEEILEIYTNLENALKDTIFYNLIEQTIM